MEVHLLGLESGADNPMSDSLLGFARGARMATVHDVAAYILERQGPLSAMKLQKLLYYSQAWNLVWEEARLFPERIEAWANGPVVPALYEKHRGQFQIDAWSLGKAEKLSSSERETIDSVLEFYGAKSPQWLSDLTHMEQPWRKAREGLAPGERGMAEITPDSMSEYYSSLPPMDAGLASAS